MLQCGDKSVALPKTNNWRPEIFLEPSTKIPFVSDGKVSKRCVVFFRTENPTVEVAEKSEKAVAKLTPLPVPLPGSKMKMLENWKPSPDSTID